jgi:hypothetical protein
MCASCSNQTIRALVELGARQFIHFQSSMPSPPNITIVEGPPWLSDHLRGLFESLRLAWFHNLHESQILETSALSTYGLVARNTPAETLTTDVLTWSRGPIPWVVHGAAIHWGVGATPNICGRSDRSFVEFGVYYTHGIG